MSVNTVEVELPAGTVPVSAATAVPAEPWAVLAVAHGGVISRAVSRARHTRHPRGDFDS